MKLKKARRYIVNNVEIDIIEGSTIGTDVMFLKWAKNSPWTRIFILA